MAVVINLAMCSRCCRILVNKGVGRKNVVFYVPNYQFSTMNTDDATMRRSIARKSFLQRENKTFNFYSSGLRSWSAETHYSVLGVDYEATQEQIRTAYIRLSKEFHPDYNAGVDDAKMETIHNKFVKINAAYSVLGNKKQRRMYDLEVLMHEDPRWKGGDEIKTDSPHHFNTRPMSFEERAAAMGFRKQDPNFYAKHGNYHRNVVVWCMVFIAVGVLVQGTAILALYKRHSTQMDLNSANNTTLLIAARANSRNFTTVQEQLNSLNIAQPIQNQDRRDTEDLDIKSA